MPKSDNDLRSRAQSKPREQPSSSSALSRDDENMKKSREIGLGSDRRNVAVLLFLYVLQGIPLGLAAAVPLILSNRHVSYRQQAEFSFAYWPFSFKIFWAPIVDSVYFARFGRRKTWLVPVQYLIGATMLLLSYNVDYYLDKSDIFSLMCMFFFLNFLAATQDIAVDGWALTMLQRRNVNWASTCNSVGQTAGYFMGYVLYMGLESYGLVTLSEFLYFWAFVFFAATTGVAILKSENTGDEKSNEEDEESLLDEEDEVQIEEPDLGIIDTYQLLWKIIRLPLMPMMLAILLTGKMGFSAADNVTSLKLVEQGVPKDNLAMLSIPMIPLQILLPLWISKYTSGSRPMTPYLRAIPLRLLFGLVFAVIVYVTPQFAMKNEDGSTFFPWYFYGIILVTYAIHQIWVNAMFVSIMAFFARISDPAVGGTYMTLLNTLTNMGGNWPATVALWFVDTITVRECVGYNPAFNGTLASDSPLAENVCHGADEKKDCDAAGGECVTQVEGYYIESVVCAVIGFLWLAWGWGAIERLQSADLSEWAVVKSTSNSSSSKKTPSKSKVKA